MRQLAALALTLALAPAALPAQEAAPESDGRSLMERGAELFFKGLREETAPMIEELRGLAEDYGPAVRSFISEMGPALSEMFDEVKDWTAYHPPEMLPNGDIILRKRDVEPEAPGEEPMKPAPPGSIDL
ncbi:MAG TPA: hypothetical protein DEA05_09190 [Rhodobacteraceae bacterium]|nr:hypothetical protein [Paracoccaceae bacterium]